MLGTFSIGDNLTSLMSALSFVDRHEHTTNCSPTYLHLKIFLSLQYSAGRYSEDGKADDAHDPEDMLASAFLHLLRLSAISSIPKLGGYSFVQLSRLQQLCQNVRECQEAAPDFTADIERHDAWCSKLRPVLKR